VAQNVTLFGIRIADSVSKNEVIVVWIGIHYDWCPYNKIAIGRQRDTQRGSYDECKDWCYAAISQEAPKMADKLLEDRKQK
jgi:hypothetical protein